MKRLLPILLLSVTTLTMSVPIGAMMMVSVSWDENTSGTEEGYFSWAQTVTAWDCSGECIGNLSSSGSFAGATSYDTDPSTGTFLQTGNSHLGPSCGDEGGYAGFAYVSGSASGAGSHGQNIYTECGERGEMN